MWNDNNVNIMFRIQRKATRWLLPLAGLILLAALVSCGEGTLPAPPVAPAGTITIWGEAV